LELYQNDDWDGDGISNYIEVENDENNLNPVIINEDYLPEGDAGAIPANVNTLMAYSQGTHGDGRLFGGLRVANNDKGYFYQHSVDVDDTDNFAIPEVLQRIEAVAKEWERRHPDLEPLKSNMFTNGDRDNLYTDDGRKDSAGNPKLNGVRFGMNDLSLENGGRMCWPTASGGIDCHNSHQNGLDVDVWFVRKDNQEGPVNVANKALYDQALSEELINLFIEVGGAIRIFVASNSEINTTEIIRIQEDHYDHFHATFPNPNPPFGEIEVTATEPQVEVTTGFKVSTIEAGPINDRYGMNLFEGYRVNVSSSAGTIYYQGSAKGSFTNLPVNGNGKVIFQLKRSIAGDATISVSTRNPYNEPQAQANGTHTITFN
ncbi:MAG: penicillin-insensitive murein endopeptidase, partial [Deltaproteobacteria bacterium]|nr:penicillin-insensitive murein endopeptidase [Deltaproteobacteria bacterium]